MPPFGVSQPPCICQEQRCYSCIPPHHHRRFTAYVYPVYVALLLFGPQDRAHNLGLNLFWDYWWPGIFLVYPFLGRVWCSVCPFMIFGELTQRWQVSRGVVLRKWPHAQGPPPPTHTHKLYLQMVIDTHMVECMHQCI